MAKKRPANHAAMVRCDHGRPVCERCRRRGDQSQCYYHPAPLTKFSDTIVQFSDDVMPINSIVTTPISLPELESNLPSVTSMGESMIHDLDGFVAAVSNDSDHRSEVLHQPSDFVHERRVCIVEDVLRELRHIAFFRNLVHTYYTVSKSANVPGPLILPAVDSLLSLVQGEGEIAHATLRSLAESIIRSTARPIVVDKSTTVRDFLNMHTGENLRLEYLGIIYSIAGRASEVVLHKQDKATDRWVYKLYKHSDTCLQLATEIAPAINDAIVWLSLENTVLCTVALGDDSEAVERHLGNVSSHIYELGYHRQSVITSNAPFFLSQCRSWIFAKAYNMAMLWSALKGRPPHISLRYSNTRLPLDLADDDIVAETSQRETACDKLTANGWSLEGYFFTASFRRARMISLQFREEALVYEYHPLTAEKVTELKNLSAQCQRAWESLPYHMRYTPDCWIEQSPVTCMTLLIIRLGFLQSEYEIFKTLERAERQATASLVRVAHEMLTLISQLSDARGRSSYVQYEFSCIILGYGLPCAMVLCVVLKNLSQHGGTSYSLPEHVQRSTIIRDLSVFVSQLDSMALSAEANAASCGRASTAVSRMLDEVLNGTTPSTALEPFGTAKDMSIAGDDMHRLDLDVMLEDIDLAGWIKSIEGTNNAIDWYNL